MLRRSLPKTLLVLLALLVIGGALAWRSLHSGFEPGGGGANEFPPRQEADGTLVLRLRLNVWGGGGAIDGRYRDVMLVAALAGPYAASATSTAASASLRVPGRIAPGGEAKTQWYEFRISRGSFSSGSQLAYRYEVTLDGNATQIPGRFEVMAP
jgi:hypothetical protein